ncbi:MAG: sorbosone dehydrogenase [Deltaproteobacteria bacterium]|nr:sorbosone dehydrogenase [Deltaproteobacteria bacterium]
MSFHPRALLCPAFAFGLLIFWSAGCGAGPFPEEIRLPPGFAIALYAEVPNARSMTLGDRGIVYVGTRRQGEVYAILPERTARGTHRVVRIAQGLTSPNGVAFRDGSLYVAEIRRILRFDGIGSRLDDPPEPVVVYDGFPTDRHHGWKFIRFGPDGLLYVPVGAPCNVCRPVDPRYASILRMRPDGGEPEIFAHGVRNTVGFDWDPSTNELWFTDNGRDLLGDDIPPDELNRAPRKGLHFGFPYLHGKTVFDPEYGEQGKGRSFTPPELELPAHVASLGMRFYNGEMFPREYRGQVFIAEHGSWNRSEPIGYRVSLVRIEGGKAVGYETFAAGWLRKGKAWGRPVDLQVMPDGSLLVSDDLSGSIYRITYGKR